MNSSNKVGT